MPFPKMKSNSNTGCLRGKYNLCVCPKSATISKNTCSRIKILRETDIDSCFQNDNVSLCSKINDQQTIDDKDIEIHNTFDGENVQLLKLSPLNDPSALRLESTENTSATTLFSPILDLIEVCIEADVNDGAGLRSDSDLVYDKITDITCLPDFNCEESSMLFEMADDYMILPFLEDTNETSSEDDVQTRENTNFSPDDSSLYFAVHQLRCRDQDVNMFAELDQSECFDPQMFFRNQPDDLGPDFQLAISKEDVRKAKAVTLVLDLDETLVHSTLEGCDDANFSFLVFFNMRENMVYVKQRPDLQMFLEKVAELFDIVIFTAGQRIYAEQLLDKLDPDGKIISHRAYRESCLCVDGNYIKDLTIFGVDLAKIAIIDNTPQVFQMQVNNGIPIKSWFDDPSDHALISLLPFLETLSHADDVRPLIAKRFGNKE